MSYQQSLTSLGAAAGGLVGSIAEIKKEEDKATEIEMNETKKQLDETNLELKDLETTMGNISIDDSGKLRLKGRFYSQKAFQELNDAYVSKEESQMRLQERFNKLSKKAGGKQ